MHFKLLSRLFIAAITGSLLFSCADKTSPTSATPEDEHEDAIQVEIEEEVKRNPSRVQWNDHTIDVNFVLSGSTSLVVGLDRYGGNVSKGHQNVSSTLRVKQVEATDMDGDGLPEILVYLNNFDHSEPKLLAFKSDKEAQRLLPLTVPTIPDAVMSNYQQGDTLIPMESSIEYRINYVANGTPTTGSFRFVWDSESNDLKMVEGR